MRGRHTRPRRFGSVVLAACIAVALAGCAEAPAASPTPSPAPSASTAEPSPTPVVTPTPPALIGAVNAIVTDRTVLLENLNYPWDIAWEPDGSALITMRDEARILRYGADGSSTWLVGVGADWLKANVDPAGEGGLLGLALLPSDPTVVYVYVTRADGNAVVRMSLTGIWLGPPRDVVAGIAKNTYHDGGRIRFGPDGYLYVTTGDAGNKPLAQDLNSLNGKILRVVAEGTDADGSAPADNPFGSLVWTYGHRNSEGLGWAPDGRMYASELGQNALDELNLIEPGNNYGWPIKEAIIGAPAGTQPGATVDSFTYPWAWWPTSEASPSGIAVTREAVYMAALRGQRLWRIPLAPEGVGVPHVLLNDIGRIRLASLGPDGALYLITSNGVSPAHPTGDVLVRITVRQSAR